MTAASERTFVGGLTGFERDLNWHKVMYNLAASTSALELEHDEDFELEVVIARSQQGWQLALVLAEANDRAARWAVWPFHRGNGAREMREFLATAEPAGLIVLAGAVVSDTGRRIQHPERDGEARDQLVAWATREADAQPRFRAPEVPINRWLGRPGKDRRSLERAFRQTHDAYRAGAPHRALPAVSELIAYAAPRGAHIAPRALYNLACFETRVARALPGRGTEPLVRRWLTKALDTLVASLIGAGQREAKSRATWARRDPALRYLTAQIAAEFDRRLRPFSDASDDPHIERVGF